MRKCETAVLNIYADLCRQQPIQRVFPHELFYRLIRERTLAHSYEIDPKDSWLVTAAEHNLPIFTPGWEDSTLANMIVASKVRGEIPDYPIKSGLEAMEMLLRWYHTEQANHDIGFFQIGGGIAGDFPICAVPLLRQDLRWDSKTWAYFCQISEAITSFGGYSGCMHVVFRCTPRSSRLLLAHNLA